MTEPVERAQSDDKWEQPGPAPQEQSAMGALAELIEVAASPDRMSDRATMSGVAAVMPTIPPGARLPPDLLLIETMPPGEYEEARQQEVMPSNLPMPSWSLLPSATAVPAAEGGQPRLSYLVTHPSHDARGHELSFTRASNGNAQGVAQIERDAAGVWRAAFGMTLA